MPLRAYRCWNKTTETVEDSVQGQALDAFTAAEDWAAQYDDDWREANLENTLFVAVDDFSGNIETWEVYCCLEPHYRALGKGD